MLSLQWDSYVTRRSQPGHFVITEWTDAPFCIDHYPEQAWDADKLHVNKSETNDDSTNHSQADTPLRARNP